MKMIKLVNIIFIIIFTSYAIIFVANKVDYKSIVTNTSNIPLKSNVYININTIDNNSMVFTFFNSPTEHLVYTYKIEIIDELNNETIKEYKVHTSLYLKENSVSNIILKASNLQSKKNYIIKISAEECINGFKVEPINIKFKTL